MPECEKYLLEKLRSPSTYKRIEVSSTAVPYETPIEQMVFIEYDAANAYGTPIRGRQLCKFPIKNKRPVVDQYIDHDAQLLTDPGLDYIPELNVADNASGA